MKKEAVSLIVVCLTYCQLLASIPPEASIHSERINTAKAVLQKLFDVAGRKDIAIPKVILTSENKRVAAYYPNTHLIAFDQLAFDVCVSMGKDSLHAIAFILGHELAHVFQTEIRKGRMSTHFLSYDKQFHANTRLEKAADVQGVFAAYLAGFRMDRVVPKLIDRIYDAYELKGHDLRGYPSFDERSGSAREVVEIANTLIDLYEATNYLVVAGNYPLAVACYEYILSYYQGRELYNNLGALYFQSAFDYFIPRTDRFVYPLEMDASTQLSKINRARGSQSLTLQEALIRHYFLEKAFENFELAFALDDNYWPAQINRACTLNLMEKPIEALAVLSNNKLIEHCKKEPLLSAKITLTTGIAYAILEDLPKAELAFSQAASSSLQLQAVQGNYNLIMLSEQSDYFSPPTQFEFPPAYQSLMATIQLGRISQLEPVALDNFGKNFRRERKGQNITFSFGDEFGSIVSIVRFKNKMAPDFDLLKLANTIDHSFLSNLVSAPTGYFLKSDRDGLVIQVDESGRVVEMAKLFVHR